MTLGVGGAAAGITSDTQQVFKCPDCGITLSRPLEEPWKTMIDVGNSSLDARKNLNYDGIQVSWDMIKRKYPNIEEGIADREIEFNQVLINEKVMNQAEIIENAKQKLNNNPIVIKHQNGQKISSKRIFAIAFCYLLEELGGSYRYMDNNTNEYYEELWAMLVKTTEDIDCLKNRPLHLRTEIPQYKVLANSEFGEVIKTEKNKETGDRFFVLIKSI